MKLVNLLLFFFVSTISFCQKPNKEDLLTPLLIEDVDKFHELDGYYEHYIDKSRSLLFEDIINKKFSSEELPISFQSTYWLKFKLKPKKNADFLLLLPNISDYLIIYAPKKNSRDYQTIKLGLLNKDNPVKIDYGEASIANIHFKSIDFSKPFYIKKDIVSDLGEINFSYPMVVCVTHNQNFIENYMKENSYTPRFQIYSIILFVSFIFFLVNFIVSKDKNYLNYSLYLFSTALLFSVRLPYIYNIINTIEPKLFHYIRIVGITSASGFYFYFVVSFLNFKDRFPKLYRLSLITLKGICVFTISYLLIIIIFPYVPNKLLIMNIFKIAFTLISLGVFIFLLFQKGSKIYKAVLISSLLLIIGNLLSIITDWSFFFLNTVLIEIIIFTAIVSYTNKVNSKKRLENKFLLEQEQINNQNLIELNTVKSNFFANIAHEFRTPLTLISNPIETTLDDQTISEIKREQFTTAKRNSDRLLGLVNQILDLSKIDAGQLKLHIQNSNATAFIAALCESFSYTAKQKDIDFKLNINPHTDDVYFDRDALEKIVVNLISNAIKYTPKNGTVICDAFIKNETLHLNVKNSGVGLTATEIKHIFQRFYQTSGQNQGTGIGLALVKELVELHKGKINVESTPNTFTNFTITIPIDKHSFKNETLVNNQHTNTNIKRQHHQQNDEAQDAFEDNDQPILLIVEDNTDVRTLLKQTFKTTYNIITAPNGEKGVKLAIEHIPDLIISDIMMPVMDGIQLTKRLKNDERTSHIPIILLTAKAGDENKFTGLEVGADDYITKPFNSKLLITKAEKLIENRRLLQQRYSQELVLLPKDISITNLDEQFLEKVQTTLDKNLIDPCFNVTEFSEAVGMSRMQLHRKIKALTGLTASAFIRSQRLKLAAQFLKTSDINISQVGYSVGFNDHSYFTKCFKEVYKCTPTEFTKRS